MNPELEVWPQMEVTEDGTKIWYNKESRRHREDGPSYETTDGYKEWYISGVNLTEEDFHLYLNQEGWPRLTVNISNHSTEWKNKDGQLHRLDGPAVKGTGTGIGEHWYKNGKRHRTDGPADCHYSHGQFYDPWYIDGVKLNEDEFYAHPECTIKKEQQ